MGGGPCGKLPGGSGLLEMYSRACWLARRHALWPCPPGQLPWPAVWAGSELLGGFAAIVQAVRFDRETPHPTCVFVCVARLLRSRKAAPTVMDATTARTGSLHEFALSAVPGA